MKTVARIYKLPDIIEEDETALSNMRALVGTQRLYDYLYSDIQITRGLSNIYLPAIISLAERINVALESCIDGSPAFISNTIFSREYKATNIISDKTVIVANPELGDKQGALVGSFAPGLYLEGVRKFDVLSYYPNLVRTLNLDPLTTKIQQVKNKLEPYQAVMSDDKILTLSIPDTKLNKQIIITVDMNVRGFTSIFVDELMIERMELKSKMKTLDDNSPEWASLDVNQLAIKVILNSITGYFGQGWATFGSLASYIAITGSGRFLIQTLIDKMENTIALDTDGIVISSKEDIKEVNIWLEKFILDFYNIDKNYIELEEEVIESAYFRDANKQYLVLQDNELIIHGASFKGSNLPKIFSTIIEDIGLRMLKDDSNLEEAIDVYYDSNQFTLSNIKKSIKIKPVNNYASKSPIGRQLGIQYEKRFGVKIKHETRLEYVKIKSKRGSSYQLVTIFDNMEDIERLDVDYYIDIVNNAIDRLGLTHMRPDQRAQTSIFDF
jgi:DNA polymerase elongation subunit (family B)